MSTLADTLDPALKSRVASANEPDGHFPIQNLPFGIFSDARDLAPRAGVAIGDFIADLAVLFADEAWRQPTLNDFVGRGRDARRATRVALSRLLRADGPLLPDHSLVARADATMHLPIAVAGYTDFYSSLEHAEAGGRIFRGADATLVPQYRDLPIAYNGRASSIIPSGTPVTRPLGQACWDGEGRPRLGPSRALDFELEVGFIVARGNARGVPIEIGDAEDHVFGLVLLNDWSARDHQRWESVPLGPFNAKGFATSISPWIVTLDALAPFRCAPPQQNPQPLSYLRGPDEGAFDIHLEARLLAENIQVPTTVTRTNHRFLYWTIAQQVAHHTINGCTLRLGDLCGSGTISGPTTDSAGSLLELTLNGRQPLNLGGEVTRAYLEDGDTVTLTGWCERLGHRIGFGECVGTIIPAINP